MDRLPFNLTAQSYDYFLGTNCQPAIADHLLGLPADNIYIVTDQTVADLYAGPLATTLRDKKRSAHLLIHPPGEQNKRLSTVESLLSAMLEKNATRQSAVVAVGGGVTGNLAGMCAALAFRGISLIHIPTTLLAMLDSVLSLKQAVNTATAKNLIGIYHRPHAVLADTAFLKSLPQSEIRSGMCEVVKNLLAISPRETVDLSGRFRPDAQYSQSDLRLFIEHGIATKLQVMSNDPYEKNTAIVLEYGHTAGHAIEAASAGQIPHGQAIALGMLAAAKVSLALRTLSSEDYALHESLLQKIGVPLRLPDSLDVTKVFNLLPADNKRGHIPCDNNQIAMVLLRSIGRPCLTGSKPLIPVPITLLKDSIAALK